MNYDFNTRNENILNAYVVIVQYIIKIIIPVCRTND